MAEPFSRSKVRCDIAVVGGVEMGLVHAMQECEAGCEAGCGATAAMEGSGWAKSEELEAERGKHEGKPFFL